MAVEKFSVSFEPDLGRALREAAEEDGVSVSAWMAEAARQRLRNRTLGLVLDEVIREQGWSWEELLAEAEADEQAFLAEEQQAAAEREAARAADPAGTAVDERRSA